MLRIIIFVFVLNSINIFSQDSSNVNLNNASQNLLNEKNKIHIDKNPLIKILPLRIWNLNIGNKNQNLEIMNLPLKLKMQKESFVESDLFYIVVGSAVAFGATAAYLKNESDKNYEKYKITGDVNYLNKTNILDIYSGVALGALQINFGYLIYKFLTD
ncbi:MAG: hypothetical protein IPH62_14160 [Ignavibacteriae bacterium]|nr:hypothetical protein [Ignavibacteriota bacterium]